MKKHLLTLGAAALVFSAVAGLASCGGNSNPAAPKARTLTDVKVGMICLEDNNSTYDKNFIDAINAAVENTGLAPENFILKTNIPESDACKTAAEELVDAGCNVVIADSFGHEAYLLEVAKANPDVQFLHCTGTMAHTEGVANFHNGFASIYEGRYLAGVVAGLKLEAMIKENSSTAHKVGYVGAFTYAEVISGYTSWYLGVKSIVPDVTMDVRFTGSWYDETGEKEAALALINDGAVLVSQHADSMGAPNACEEKNVPNVSYNGSTYSACPNTFLVSSRIDWTSIFENLIMATADGEGDDLDSDLIGSILDGSVKTTDVGSAAVSRSQAILNQTKNAIVAGDIKIFDTSKFTVNTAYADPGFQSKATIDGEGHLLTYMADVDTDDDYTPDTQVIIDGEFAESSFRAAPYFDVQIDGITLKNTAF